MKHFSAIGIAATLLAGACSPPSTDGDGDADADADADGGVECEPDAVTCFGDVMRRCNADGDGWAAEEACTGDRPLCVAGAGCLLCQPNAGDCDGDVPRTCDPDGLGWARRDPCDTAAGQQCILGHCTDPCAGLESSSSYVGCEYWAVDLPNAQQQSGLSPENANFAVVISNGHDTATATVQVFAEGDDETPILSVAVPPNDVRTLEINPALDPSRTNVAGTGIHRRHAFHVVSNLPVTAYQFNPLNNTEAAYSNDASLLLPVNGLDTDYIVATGDGIVGGEDTNGDGTADVSYNWGAFVAVVAVTDGTEVTVEPNAEIIAGDDLPGGTGPITVTLDAFDVLNVESLADEAGLAGNGNLSGSYVHASAPVAVFSGNVATVVPGGPDSVCCADHLEEQIIPLSAWGQQFVVARGQGRRREGDWEPELFRITGGNVPEGQDAITLTYRPAAPAGAPTRLTQGESVEIASVDDFVVEADGPILVTSYFVSSFYTAPEIDPANPLSVVSCFNNAQCQGLAYAAVCVMGFFGGSCMPIGDPSMTVVPPVEQYRGSYVFLVPNDYAYNAVTVVAPMGSTVTLDGSPLPAFRAIDEVEGTAYGVVRTLVGAGTHRLEADGGAEVGLTVYGMDKDVSYGYPGGLDLEVINII